MPDRREAVNPLLLERLRSYQSPTPIPPGTVRVNNLANLEALLNIIANGAEIMGVTNGIPTLLLAGVLLTLPDRRKWARWFFVLGFFLLIGGLSTPGLINWLLSDARDANLFS